MSNLKNSELCLAVVCNSYSWSKLKHKKRPLKWSQNTFYFLNCLLCIFCVRNENIPVEKSVLRHNKRNCFPSSSDNHFKKAWSLVNAANVNTECWKAKKKKQVKSYCIFGSLVKSVWKVLRFLRQLKKAGAGAGADTPDFKWQGWSNGCKNQNPKKSQGQN